MRTTGNAEAVEGIESDFAISGISQRLVARALHILQRHSYVDECFHKLCVQMLIQCVQFPQLVSDYTDFENAVHGSAKVWAVERYNRLMERLDAITEQKCRNDGGGDTTDSLDEDCDALCSSVSFNSSHNLSDFSDDESDYYDDVCKSI